MRNLRKISGPLASSEVPTRVGSRSIMGIRVLSTKSWTTRVEGTTRIMTVAALTIPIRPRTNMNVVMTMAMKTITSSQGTQATTLIPTTSIITIMSHIGHLRAKGANTLVASTRIKMDTPNQNLEERSNTPQTQTKATAQEAKRAKVEGAHLDARRHNKQCHETRLLVLQ